MPTRANPVIEAAERVAAALQGVDYGVALDDFVLHELLSLIDEDRASFDDTDFRDLLDEGIREHVAGNLPLRADLAGRLRRAGLTGQARTVGLRVVHALEDLDAELCNVGALLRSYAAYLFRRLEDTPGADDERVTGAADLLFDSAGDRDAAETALGVLCGAPGAIAARVLAHAVAEPLLDEDLEARACAALKTMWPLPRLFMRYSLHGHPHEDIPLRWFQLFVDMDEPWSVEAVLEELRAHGGTPEHREDLSALVELLHASRDPELEDKILGFLNSPNGAPTADLLRGFLESHRPLPPTAPWTERARGQSLNRRYLAAAALYDGGDTAGADRSLQALLADAPGYPLAPALRA